jgi:hypothetical protein
MTAPNPLARFQAVSRERPVPTVEELRLRSLVLELNDRIDALVRERAQLLADLRRE